MTNVPLIQKEDAKLSLEKLNSFYENGLIPPEKKTYLTNLKKSFGPYLGVEALEGKTHFIQDAASQIATLGLGLNPTSHFGAIHHLEIFENNLSSANFQKVKEEFSSFLARQLNSNKVYLNFTNSGAEANELAIGQCFEKRVSKKAKRILTFEGSFHGRMMLTLAATWNKSKREPFQWEEFVPEYIPYPEIHSDQYIVNIDNSWRELWESALDKSFTVPKSFYSDNIVKKEIESLLVLREKLLSNEFFAILIEPMQCEGGDRYSTNRFHTALNILSKTFNVPLIYDEVQTGFHLGQNFFWHQSFDLKDSLGTPLRPEYIVCAKKSQTGIVIGFQKHLFENTEVNFSSVIRGYYQGLTLDQEHDKILEIQKDLRERLNKLQKKYPKYFYNVRASGVSFAIDLPDNKMTMDFIGKRFDLGLLYYPAGDKTLRFRLNTQYKKVDIDYLFNSLETILISLTQNKELSLPNPPDTFKDQSSEYSWHSLFLKSKCAGRKNVEGEVNQLFKNSTGAELIRITKNNFKEFKNDILNLQQEVYEPARQTSIELFEKAATHPSGIALAVKQNNALNGIVFAAPLSLFPLERGLRIDPYFNDENSLYMMDCTVSKSLQGMGIGKYLKYALSIIACEEGIERLQGRNRDKMAKGMLKINLSLGAFIQSYIKEDYPDFEKYRDVLYYSIPLKENNNDSPLYSGEFSNTNLLQFSEKQIEECLPEIVNKVCLSNFVSENFLKNVKKVASLFPEDLQHIYTTSGLSECIDKASKTIWYNSQKTTHRMISFTGHYFGTGSNLARSLSSIGENYFDVDHLPHPTDENKTTILKEVEKLFKNNDYLATWIEPIPQKIMQRVPKDFLQKLKQICAKHNVSLVYNETLSSAFRYDDSEYFASNHQELTPDVSLCHLGGQAGVVACKKELFIEKPLMMISTWDGDEFSFSRYVNGLIHILKNKERVLKNRENLKEELEKKLSKLVDVDFSIQAGFGKITGNLPLNLKRKLKKIGPNEYTYWPNDSLIEKHIKEL